MGNLFANKKYREAIDVFRRSAVKAQGGKEADRLMIAIGSHISRLEGGIVTTLEASVYARWQRDQMQAWWEGEGRRWPQPGKEWRRQMTHIRRAYHEACGPYRRLTDGYAESW